MSRAVSLLSLGCVAAIGATSYGMLYRDESGRIAAPPGAPEPRAAAGDASAAPTAGSTGLATELAGGLEGARRSHSATAIAQFVAELRRRLAATPDDAATWRGLAAALLHKVTQRAALLGIRPGRPLYGELPADVAADLDAAEAALARAAEFGDDGVDRHRLAAEIASQRITGLATALRWNGRIEEAIALAGERDPDDPLLQLVIGVRKLMAPSFLGQDIERALEHFRYVAKARPDDERPAIFAALANHLRKQRLEAIAWLEQAVERNPDNAFARVVLGRLRRGEDDPFGRDVTPAEAAAGK